MSDLSWVRLNSMNCRSAWCVAHLRRPPESVTAWTQNTGVVVLFLLGQHLVAPFKARIRVWLKSLIAESSILQLGITIIFPHWCAWLGSHPAFDPACLCAALGCRIYPAFQWNLSIIALEEGPIPLVGILATIPSNSARSIQYSWRHTST